MHKPLVPLKCHRCVEKSRVSVSPRSAVCTPIHSGLRVLGVGNASGVDLRGAPYFCRDRVPGLGKWKCFFAWIVLCCPSTKRIKDEIVCFAHLRWCHNGWASNILSGGCRRSRHPPWLKYWMPIHYDTIEDGQNKQSHLLISFLVRIVLFLHFIGGIYLSKILLHHFIGFIWIITPLMKINVSIQETKFIAWRSSRA